MQHKFSKNPRLHYRYNFATLPTLAVQVCTPKVGVQNYKGEHLWQWPKMFHFAFLFLLGTGLSQVMEFAERQNMVIKLKINIEETKIKFEY